MFLLGRTVVVVCWCPTSASPKNSSQVLGYHQDLIPIPHLVGVQGPTTVLEFLGSLHRGHVEHSHLVAWQLHQGFECLLQVRHCLLQLEAQLLRVIPVADVDQHAALGAQVYICQRLQSAILGY